MGSRGAGALACGGSDRVVGSEGGLGCLVRVRPAHVATFGSTSPMSVSGVDRVYRHASVGTYRSRHDIHERGKESQCPLSAGHAVSRVCVWVSAT